LKKRILSKPNANAKFDETIEIAIEPCVDTRHRRPNVVPGQTPLLRLAKRHRKSVRVCCICHVAKATKLKQLVPDLVGAED